MDLKLIEEQVSAVLAQEAAELVDLRLGRDGNRMVLRFFVDKHGGVNLGDCERLSKRIGALLDMDENLKQPYALEVSSPGIDRVVKKAADFQRFAGHRIKVKLRMPVEGRRRFLGYLRGMEGDEVVLENDGQTVRFGLASIEEARLDPEIGF